MTPYQYRQLKKKMFRVHRVWHNIKGDVFDVLCTLMITVSIFMLPAIPMLISNIFR